MIIDAKDLVVGRIATKIATSVLKGEKVIVVNAEQAVMIGNKKQIVARYTQKRDSRIKGNPLKGPKYPRMADRLFRRIVRGMLPMSSSRGRNAFRNVKVFIGVPDEFKGKEFTKVSGSEYSGKSSFIYLKDLSIALGGKYE